jgi:hypothetical protein
LIGPLQHARLSASFMSKARVSGDAAIS